MAKTISITIPKNLYDRLQVVKDALNVSRICQEAIASVVEIEEFKGMGGQEMETVIERLRAEKRAFVKNCKEMGFKAGLKEAKELSYEGLVAIIKGGYPFEYTASLEDDINDLKSDDPSFDSGTYMDGWMEGVQEFWKQVKSKL